MSSDETLTEILYEMKKQTQLLEKIKFSLEEIEEK